MEPLAAKIRPQNLDDFIGQNHLVGAGKPLRLAIENKERFSFILWGPPGVGKTTLARIYANALGANFLELSAVSAGKKDIKDFVEEGSLQPKVLFLDEIHRFNKAQQDFLLPYVETGTLTLIGATTENPSFEVIPALLSRSRVFVLNELSPEELSLIIDRSEISITEDARSALIDLASGDARSLLTVLDNITALYGAEEKITISQLEAVIQGRNLRYDKTGEEHYNTISAFIKSMRASDVDATVYYLARMIHAGEDPKFIARRMVIFASEDIGLAQPTALVVANAAFEAVEKVGLPEGAINLAHAATYLALAKKDRSSYDALRAAEVDVRKFGNLPIPMEVRNAPTKLMKSLGYGKGYEKYPKTGSYLPEKIRHKKYFPKDKKKEH